MFGEERQHLSIEGRKVGRPAAADPITVANHFRIPPVGSRIPEIVLNRMIAGHFTA